MARHEARRKQRQNAHTTHSSSFSRRRSREAEKPADGEVLIEQRPVDSITARRELGRGALKFGSGGQRLRAALPRNPYSPIAKNQNQRIRGGFDCGGRDRLSRLHGLFPQDADSNISGTIQQRQPSRRNSGDGGPRSTCVALLLRTMMGDERHRQRTADLGEQVGATCYNRSPSNSSDVEISSCQPPAGAK